MTSNTYKVPIKQWRKWDDQARFTFNRVYSSIIDNWHILAPDSMQPIKPAARKVLAWNIAWVNAEACHVDAKEAA